MAFSRNVFPVQQIINSINQFKVSTYENRSADSVIFCFVPSYFDETNFGKICIHISYQSQPMYNIEWCVHQDEVLTKIRVFIIFSGVEVSFWGKV